MGVSWWVSGLLGASDGAWAGWSQQHQHHPLPTNTYVWSDACQRKPLQGGCVGHQVKNKTPRSKCQVWYVPGMCKNTHSLHQQPHQVQTKIINHSTKCKRRIKMEGGGIVSINVFLRCCGRGRKNVTSVPRWWGWLVVPGLWYLVYLIRDIFVFFCRYFLSLYVRTWYVSTTMVVYS